MFKSTFILLFFFSITLMLFGQNNERSISLITDKGTIEGSLLLPISSEKLPVVLIIAGSGPTDRNGNNPMMTNNSLKMLAEGLFNHGIASIRFDKRGIAKSKPAGGLEAELQFEHYVDDVKAWVKLIKADDRFSDIIVLGHSEGSLIGMIASQNIQVDKFISVAGAGYPAADILRTQLMLQPAFIFEESYPILEKLEDGETVDDVPEILNSLFRPSVQPYLISWFRYNPQEEISKLKCPVLIIQGTTDIQVSLKDAHKLSESNKEAKKVIIEGMNHVLKASEIDRLKNIQTYSNPNLPLKDGLVKEIVSFIQN
jgi:pimeloyl-ACP methyl ester carboxylesterase